MLIRRVGSLVFLSPPKGVGFSYLQKGCHLVGVYRAPQAGLEAWLGVHITFVSGLFVVDEFILVSGRVLGFFEPMKFTPMPISDCECSREH